MASRRGTTRHSFLLLSSSTVTCSPARVRIELPPAQEDCGHFSVRVLGSRCDASILILQVPAAAHTYHNTSNGGNVDGNGASSMNDVEHMNIKTTSPS